MIGGLSNSYWVISFIDIRVVRLDGIFFMTIKLGTMIHFSFIQDVNLYPISFRGDGHCFIDFFD